MHEPSVILTHQPKKKKRASQGAGRRAKVPKIDGPSVASGGRKRRTTDTSAPLPSKE